MKITKTIITILFATFLVSCLKIKPQVIGDISFQFNRCQITCYDINEAAITRPENCNVTKSKEINKKFEKEYYILKFKDGEKYLEFVPGIYELEVCDEIVGPFIDDYARTIKPWAKKAIKHAKD